MQLPQIYSADHLFSISKILICLFHNFIGQYIRHVIYRFNSGDSGTS